MQRARRRGVRRTTRPGLGAIDSGATRAGRFRKLYSRNVLRNLLRWACVESCTCECRKEPFRKRTGRGFVEPCALSCRVSGIAAG